MNISIVKEKILHAVSVAERIVGKKESLPVLSCLLLEVGKEITLRATNLESGVRMIIGGEMKKTGTVAVPVSVFSQTLRALSQGGVTFSTENDNLLIESKGTRTLIKAVPHTEFPNMVPLEKKGAGITIARVGLLRALQSVAYAASTSMIRPELGSVFLGIEGDTLTAVATDSFRLAEKTLRGVAKGGSGDILIPLKHVQELMHILDRIEDDTVTLIADESQIALRANNLEFVARVIDAAFPNYKEIIPKTFAAEATVLRSELSDILKKARVFSGTEQRVGLHLYPKKKVFDVTAQTAAIGEMADSLDAALSGEDIDINFHIGYLSDALPLIDSDSLVLGFSGPGKPLVIRGVSDASLTYLVMPLNR